LNQSGANRPQSPGRRQFLEGAVIAGTTLGAAANPGFAAAARAAALSGDAEQPADPPGYLRRGSESYERARQDAVWNGKRPERYPDVIRIANNAGDVVEAVRLARRKGWKIGIRSGGHGWNAPHLRNGGLLLDLSYLNDIRVDLQSQTVSIGPAVRARDLQAKLNQHGFYFPTATCPTVGLGGYLLGGGASFTGGIDGVACNSIAAVDVVLADGRQVRADDTSHPEIMWAVRGAGPGFFGAVTRFHLRVKPLPRSMLSSVYVFPRDAVDEFLEWSISMLPSIPAQVSANSVGVASWLPHHQGTILTLFPIAMGEREDETRALLEPFEQCPFLERAVLHQPPAPWTYDAGYALQARMYLKGHRYRADALWVNPQLPGFAEPVKRMLKTLPSPHSHVLWAPWNTDAPLHPNSAYSLHTPLSVHPYGICEEQRDDDAMNAWVNEALRSLEPFSNHGGKVNDNDLAAYPKYVLSPDNTRRLEELRGKYDPDGFFCGYLGSPRPAA
jgi:FAD/FMN-containing dehydrogenase